MKALHATLSLASLVTLAVACGAPPAPAVAPKPSPSSDGAAQPLAPAGPEPVVEAKDLKPMGTPDGVFLVGRLRAGALDRFGGARALLADNAPAELLSVIDDRAPVEVVAQLADGLQPPRFVVAVGLRSLQHAADFVRAQRMELRFERPGVYRVDAPHARCALASSLGQTSARLVCSRRRSDLDALLPYATTGLFQAVLPAKDVAVSVQFAPAQARYGGHLAMAKGVAPGFLLQLLAPKDDKAERKLVDALGRPIDELVAVLGDLGSLELGVDAGVGGSVVTSAALRFRSEESWSVRTALAPNRNAPAPAELFTLPADATAGWFFASTDSKASKPLIEGTVDLLDALTHAVDLPAPARKQLTTLLRQQYVGASFGVTIPVAAGSASVVITQQPLAQAKRQLELTAALLGDAKLRERIAASGKGMAAIATGVVASGLPNWRVLPAPKGAPRGATFFEQTAKLPAGPGAGGSQTKTVMLFQKGASTYTVTAADVAGALAAHQKLTTAGPSLANRAELGVLKAEPLIAGGFFTGGELAELVGSLPLGVSVAPSKALAKPFQWSLRSAQNPKQLTLQLDTPTDALLDLLRQLAAASSAGESTAAP